jgi:hypothetical protein
MSPKKWQKTKSNEKSEDERLHKMKWMTNMDDKLLHIYMCVCVCVEYVRINIRGSYSLLH